MRYKELSPRLAAVARMIPRGVPLADVGTDHAYLPIELVQSGHTPWAVAVDVREGPYERARRAVENAGLSERIDVRLGDGLTVLEPGEVHTVVMAGMGGGLMRRLLSADPEKTRSFQRLVLQPNMASYQLRSAMFDLRWKLMDEQLVWDDGHLYEVLAYESGNDDTYAAAAETLGRADPFTFLRHDWFLLFLLGPHLLLRAWYGEDEEQRRFLLQQVDRAIDKRQHILAGLKQARGAAEQEKMHRLTTQLAQLEVLAQCMRTGRP